VERIVMNYKAFKEEMNNTRVGREYQHLEDLVFVHGSRGAMYALDVITQLSKDSSDVSVKFDGAPVIYFGRDPSGTFVLVGKNGWGRNKSTSSSELKEFILTTGNNEPWRHQFADEMSDMFDIVEKSMPADFRGYIYGDLLYYPKKSIVHTNDFIKFTPNKVTYSVAARSDIGKSITNSQVGIAVHSYFNEFGSKDALPITDMPVLSDTVLSLGPIYVSSNPVVNLKQVINLRRYVRAASVLIDEIITPIKGLSDLSNIIYTFVNQQTKGATIENINLEGFLEWLEHSKVTKSKQARIIQLHKHNQVGLPMIFLSINQIMAIKNAIIAQYDSTLTIITSHTGTILGGEGYIAQKSKIKLVPRHRWTPS